MENLIKTFETLKLQYPPPTLLGPPAPTPPLTEACSMICLLVQENNALKMEIQRLRALVVVQTDRIPNWVH